MECEEEELEPWQREVMEDDEEEEMDVVCQVKQEEEFVNGPGECGNRCFGNHATEIRWQQYTHTCNLTY